MDKIYLDACCLNRPFDDQTQERIRLESEAVLLILNRLEHGQGQRVGSSALEYEVLRVPDPERRRRLFTILGFIKSWSVLDNVALVRAREIHSWGFRALDALHIACAEGAGSSVLLTTDDRMLRAAQRNSDGLRVRVENPIEWLRGMASP